MKRQALNFIIDSLALVGLVFLIATGLLQRYLLPPGSGHNLSIWGLTRHEWGDIHFWIAVFIITVVTIHLALHWRWIVCFFQKKPKEGSGMRVGLGIAGLTLLLLISAAPFLSPKEKIKASSDNKANHSHSHEEQSHSEKEHSHSTSLEAIRGYMTLEEVNQSTGVPIDHLLKQLGISENIPPNQKLGELRRKYNFDMEQVRQIIKSYQK